MSYTKMTSSVTLLLIFLSLTIKSAYSVKCYVCDNCLNVDQNTATQDNCGACLKGGIPKIFMQRKCVDTCTDAAAKFAIKDLLDCCTSDLCNDAKRVKPFVAVTIVIYAIWTMITGPKLN
ncbi:unnamed protein product [Heterobilharzia americana]|nr:unnamed protein product [Heterobilharzia americana]CAH8466718.1 unnamed protein product [Heterobilharzia americana]